MTSSERARRIVPVPCYMNGNSGRGASSPYHACEIVSVPCVCGVIVSTAGAAHGPWGVWALDTGKGLAEM